VQKHLATPQTLSHPDPTIPLRIRTIPSPNRTNPLPPPPSHFQPPYCPLAKRALRSFSEERASLHFQSSKFKVQRSTFNVRRSTFNVRRSPPLRALVPSCDPPSSPTFTETNASPAR
jgi:hypothetical protein